VQKDLLAVDVGSVTKKQVDNLYTMLTKRCSRVSPSQFNLHACSLQTLNVCQKIY